LILLTRPLRQPTWRSARRQAAGAVDLAVRAWRRQLAARGPQAVASSLTRGLTLLDEPFERDPRGLANGPEVVGVLSSLEALEDAIAWRRERPDRRLLAGPNIVVLPSDAPSLMTAPEIDACVVPSDWVRDVYEADAPDLRGRIVVWPAGVDTEYWVPTGSDTTSRRAVVYIKELDGQLNASTAEIQRAQAVLGYCRFAVTVLRYGAFTPEEYRLALRDADLVVFFTPTESQCIAQLEAWATGVPTFVWAGDRWQHAGTVHRSSSAPYLSSATGRCFADADELSALLQQWERMQDEFRPREWVLANMTDALSAKAYLRIARQS